MAAYMKNKIIVNVYNTHLPPTALCIKYDLCIKSGNNPTLYTKPEYTQNLYIKNLI